MTPFSNNSREPFGVPTLEEIAGLFVIPTAICIKAPADYSAQLTHAERHNTHSMGERRLADYSTGRACARSVLQTLGHTGFSLASAADRQPLWPAGVVGSISHCEGVAVAVASTDANCRGLGVDVERTTILEDEVMKMVCTEKELSLMSALPPDQRHRAACLIFSIKESLFKCFYPVYDLWFDFQQASVLLSQDGQSFEAEFDSNLPFADLPSDALLGRCAVLKGVVASSAMLQAQPTPTPTPTPKTA